MNPFMEKVVGDLKTKGLADSSISLYLRSLEKLNGGKPFTSFAFLTKVPAILQQISEGYKPNTQRSILIAIVSVLNAVQGLPKTMTRITNKYYEVLKAVKRGVDETDALNAKSESQKENWLSWDQVKAKMDELAVIAAQVKGNSLPDLNKLLDALVLGLYVYNQPRRNKDYIDMVVVPSAEKAPNTDVNILDLKAARFIFQNYKTAAKYGTQTLPVPAELMELIRMYLTARGVWSQLTAPRVIKRGNKTVTAPTPEVPFLLQPNGKPFNVNGITRILNRVFGAKVGSSLLRHIFLSGKYGKVLEEQKKDAEAMGNSVDIQQKSYIKTD